MPYRLIAAIVAVLTLSIPASALSPGRFADPAVVAAASRMKEKDYRGAREAALKVADVGLRTFLVGMTDVEIEFYEDAAPQLAAAADAFPLLADYALYNQGLALSKLSRPEDAVAPLQRLVKGHPGSRLVRPALLLSGDALFAAARWKEALEAYTGFVERYPLGNDSLKAIYQSALCREKLGDAPGAVSMLRGIWIRNPGSPLAQQAADELARLSEGGVRPAPYTVQELVKRATALYDVGQFGKAAAAFQEILPRAEGDLAPQVRLKLGQSQFRSKHYRDALETLRPLAERGAGPEGCYWHARALEKTGAAEQAYARYVALSDPAAGGAIAELALLDAAYLKRFGAAPTDSLRHFQNHLNRYPDSPKRPGILWEVAWVYYQSGDYRSACDYLHNLAQYREHREKSLYWLGRSLTASGNQKDGQAQLAALISEFPFGYYTLLCNGGRPAADPPQPPKSLAPSLPYPAGMEREKALIALGLFEEAGRELSGQKKGRPNLGLARLYLEMENYNAAYHLAGQDFARSTEGDGAILWGLGYPLAFRQEVAREAAASKVPESLVWAVMRQESNYSPTARSPVGAVGLMQIMPATAESIAKGGSGRLTSPDLNIRLGARHLRDLLDSFAGNVPLSIAAYNAGGGNARRWHKSFGKLPLDEFVESITFKETREYVKKVTTAMALYQRLYGLPALSPLGTNEN